MTPPDDWDDTVASLPGALLDVDTGPSQAFLVVVRGNNVGETFPVAIPTMVIGRGAGVDLRLNDEGVSRFHCKLHQVHNQILVEDLGSRNGTYVNGEPVLPTHRVLVEGDRVQIGTTSVLRFTYVETSPRTSIPDLQSEVRDPLTGALGRRFFMDQLDRDVATALTEMSSLSLALVHIDRYPEIAADRGQLVLDQLLVTVSKLIVASLRTGDTIARMSAGDFALVSRWASPGDMFMLAERLRKHVHGDATLGGATLSLGIAAIHELPIETAQDLLVAAGGALNRARSQGGNRTVLCTPDLIREPRNRATV